MHVVGAEFVQRQLEKPGYFFKMIINEFGAAFFSASIQHNTVKFSGLSYDDGPKENALAAIVTDGRIEIRKHPAMSDGRVEAIVQALLNCAELSGLRDCRVMYQGKTLI